MATAGSSPYLNYELIDKLQLDPPRCAASPPRPRPRCRTWRASTRAISCCAARCRTTASAAASLRGFNAQRSGDLEIILEPYWMRQAQGTTHGTPYNYDAHIPLILMGSRISAGEYSDHVALNDLAPTLATLVGVEIPAGSSGRVLTEALRSAAPEPVRRTR